MARFLSPEWFEAVDREQGDRAGEPAVLTLQQVVTGTPDGDVRYQVVVGENGTCLRRGSAETPDMTFTSDYPTATDIARGRLSVQAALSAGRLRVGGDTARIAAHQQLLAGVDPLPGSVRTSTEWDTESDQDEPGRSGRAQA